MAAMAALEATDGPVMSVINKRLRALRKKLNRIAQMEESVAQGKTLNKEQEEVLRSKPSVLASIDELEKLRPQVASAVQEEHQLAVATKADSAVEKAKPRDGGDDSVRDLLNLLYFGSLFTVSSQSDYTSTMLTRTHERGCCLTYDYVTDDDSADLLGEKDLDSISMLSGLLMSRPVDSSLSHRNALLQCIERAKLWLANSDQPVDPKAPVTYAALRERLNRIIASDYFTTTPEMKASVEVAAAAAAGNYASFQVPVEGPEAEEPVAEPPQGEGSVEEHQGDKDETAAEFQKHEEDELQPSPTEELNKDEAVIENPPESSVQPEDINPQGEEADPNHRERESKDHQHAPRRNYTNQRGGRGGGRRGGSYYSNGRGSRTGGRGSGPYQNGGNSYYEQPGDYYPRNYYNNGRGRGGGGGSSGRGGGYSYNHYRQGGAAAQGGQATADVGVAS